MTRAGRGHLYPQRQRCLACHGYFGFTVALGLYCSYECADLEPPSSDWRDWPREHFTLVSGKAQPKRPFYSRQEADLFIRARNFANKVAYLCDYCAMFHIGRPKSEEIL